jgi:hypothetical protein
MRQIANEVAAVVNNVMMMAALVFGVEVDRPIRECSRPTTKNSMVILCVRMIRGQQQLPIGAVNAATVPVQAFHDWVTIDQGLQFRR